LSPSAVESVRVTKSFQDVQAVKGITLSVGEGQFFSLLGPSGCGKTTLLRMIAGFESPTTGQILVGGKDMSGVPPHRRPVNMVFQSYALFPHLTVFENVAFGLKVGKACPSSDIAQRVNEALHLVRLPHVAQRFPRELSGGQQQRIAFARAIVNKPFVLLLDEPLSALDPHIRQEMQAELARFKKELGITFIMVTHDQSEAFALSDQIAVFNGGLLEQVGSPEEIYENPQSAFVADFIGHTNVLDGKILEVLPAGILRVNVRDQFEIIGQTPKGSELAAGQECVVWVRTDDICVFKQESDATKSDTNTIHGAVVHRSYQGYTSEYLIQCGEVKLIALLENETDGVWEAGDEVILSIPHRLTNVLVKPATTA
jgi:spermidine/putrescine transport system ATP-binding protein